MISFRDWLVLKSGVYYRYECFARSVAFLEGGVYQKVSLIRGNKVITCVKLLVEPYNTQMCSVVL